MLQSRRISEELIWEQGEWREGGEPELWANKQVLVKFCSSQRYTKSFMEVLKGQLANSFQFTARRKKFFFLLLSNGVSFTADTPVWPTRQIGAENTYKWRYFTIKS